MIITILDICRKTGNCETSSRLYAIPVSVSVVVVVVVVVVVALL